jgi:hypothetical protein
MLYKIRKNLKIIALIILSLFLVWLLWGSLVENGKRNKIKLNRMEKYLGKTFIINRDTLMIMDYNLCSEKFKLSNGLEVRESIIINQLTNVEDEY